MNLNIYLVVLTFIIILIVIQLSDNITTAVLIITLLANFLIICSQLSSINIANFSIKTENGPEETPLPADDNNEEEYHMYGPAWDRFHNYQLGYTDAYEDPKFVIGTDASEATQGIDGANTLMAERRTRDKKCIDGAVTKTADYYRHHFGDELSQEEKKVWWGHYDL